MGDREELEEEVWVEEEKKERVRDREKGKKRIEG